MRIKKASMAQLNFIAMWVKRNYNSIEDYFVSNGAELYVVDGKHRFLAYRGWVWNLQDTGEITELLDELNLFDRPRSVAKYYIASAVCQSLWYRKVLAETILTAPVPRRPGSKIAEYREDMRQYILNTYYPN